MWGASLMARLEIPLDFALAQRAEREGVKLEPCVLPACSCSEFNDLDWVGSDVRDTVVESLSRGLSWGRTLTGMVWPFAEFLDAAGTERVIDLCAGAGGPAEIVVKRVSGASGASRRSCS
ncbi:MAG: hypothetical protein IPI67_19635 [Myxococcales bacterium]|nr:hypothetical protein [Myxococcales bacterium]